MAGLALEGESEAAGRFLEKARERTDLIIEHAPLDGAWSEGVQYWEYGPSYFLRFLEALKTSGTADYYPRYDWLKKAGYFAHPLLASRAASRRREFRRLLHRARGAPVARRLSLLPGGRRLPQRPLPGLSPTRLATPQPYKFSWMDFIAWDPSVKPADFRELPTFKHFDDSGFVMMRSSWRDDATLVGFRCGPAPGHRNQKHPLRLERRGFGPGHQHPDINSFSIFAHGKWLAIDPGYVHMKMTAEHNTVLVNGHGQAGAGREWLDFMAFESREPAPAILRAETHPDYDYVTGDAGNIYVDEARLASFRRHLLFLKPDVVVVADDLVAKAPSRFEWLLQALDTIRPASTGGFMIDEGGVRLAVNPVLPAKYAASLAERPFKASNLSGKLVTLNLRAEGVPQTRFLVVLTVLKDASDSAPQVSYTPGKLEIRRPGRSWVVNVTEADPVFTVASR